MNHPVPRPASRRSTRLPIGRLAVLLLLGSSFLLVGRSLPALPAEGSGAEQPSGTSAAAAEESAALTAAAAAAAAAADGTADDQSVRTQPADSDSRPPADTAADKPPTDKPATGAAIELPWMLRPYRVLVVLEIPQAPDWPQTARQALVSGLQADLVRYLGGLWQAEIQLGDDLHSDPATWRQNRLPGLRRSTLDKIFLLRLDATGGGYLLQGQEWDETIEDLGPLQTVRVYDRRQLGDKLVSLIRRVYRSVARLEPHRDGSVRIEARGGEQTPPDPAWSPLQPNTAWEPYSRYLSPEQTLLRVERIPWTYVLPRPGERGQADCEVVSGLRSPLNVRRRRMELVAVAVRPLHPRTRIQFRTLGAGHRPCAGYTVEWQTDPKQPPIREVTDRQGMISVPASAGGGTPLLLQVRNGQVKLASLPLIPGVQAFETVDLLDDDPRLQAEGQISLLQTELIDTVAQRAVLAARARQAAQTGNWDEVEKLLKQQAGLRSSASFVSDLNAIRVTALRVAKAGRNRLTERRIQRLCDETAELITHYLATDKLRALREELQELRQASEDLKDAAK